MTFKLKKWHVATIVAVLAIIALIIVLFMRRRENLDPCPPVPPGDILTSYTQASNCLVTCQTADPNATVMREPGGPCRSTCKPGYVKSATTGACTVSTQVSSAVIENMKLDMMNMTDPKMKQQMTAQIASMEAQLKAATSTATPPMA